MYIEVKGKRTGWWRLMAGNRKVLACSEVYTRIRSVRRIAKATALKLGLKLVDRTK
jgi:hypothetical protein